MSLLVSFEGIDGTGKSTQIAKVKEWLLQEGWEVLVSREPGGTELGEAIRSILLDPRWKNMTARAEFFLYSASRSQHVEEVIRPHLEKPKGVVVLDRFADSSTAYQGGGRELGIETIEQINPFATYGLFPALTFVLDVSYEVSVQRRAGQEADRLEKNAHDFFERTRAAYHELCKRHPERMVLINAEKSPDEVFAEIRSHLQKKLFSS